MKFLIWNLENLFLVPSARLAYNQALKPEKKVRQIVALINELSPDILFLCEVGGKESLKELAHRLEGDFRYYYTEGNSDRGIGLGFLIKTNFHPTQFHTHAGMTLPHVSLDDRVKPRSFSRDAAELWLCDDIGAPKLIIWGLHLKSAQDRQGNDFRGARQRAAEVRGLVKLMKERQQQYPNTPQWVCGDFNGIASGDKLDPEFEHFAVHFSSHQDLLEQLGLPPQSRWTYASGHDGQLPVQLDYFFMPKTTPTCEPEDSGVVHLWQRLGINAGPAYTASQRELWPSDHLPLFASWSKLPF